MMPAERDDWCTSCGTAPCQHPMSPIEPARRSDVAWLLILALLGWVMIAIAAAAIA